jgi:hypothetical protein
MTLSTNDPLIVTIEHNFTPKSFMWLWAKYVIGFNEKHHCTNAIRGRYSRTFSKNNVELTPGHSVAFDEAPAGTYDVIYICGVARNGYSRRQNYCHNVHVAILPLVGVTDDWTFECWRMTVHNGRLLPIPLIDQLPPRYLQLPGEYTSCRIFRWAACWYGRRACFTGASPAGRHELSTL